MAASQVRDLDEPFSRIDAATAKQMIDRGDVQIVDVREPAEFVTGRIPGAVLIPLNALLTHAPDLRRDCDLVFVCAVGVRSALASEMAAAIGCTRLFNLEGGMAAWSEQGFPVEK